MIAVKTVIMGKKISDVLQAKLAGTNISALARELDIPKSLLADWVGARRTPSLKNVEALNRLAQHLDLNLEQLLLGREQQESKIISSISFSDNGREYKINVMRTK
jgi:transposase-like protein